MCRFCGFGSFKEVRCPGEFFAIVLTFAAEGDVSTVDAEAIKEAFQAVVGNGIRVVVTITAASVIIHVEFFMESDSARETVFEDLTPHVDSASAVSSLLDITVISEPIIIKTTAEQVSAVGATTTIEIIEKPSTALIVGLSSGLAVLVALGIAR